MGWTIPLFWSHPTSVFVNRALCVYSGHVSVFSLLLPSRSLSLSGRALGPVSDQSPLRRRRLTGGCLSCGDTHQQTVSHNQNALRRPKNITLYPASLHKHLDRHVCRKYDPQTRVWSYPTKWKSASWIKSEPHTITILSTL